MSAPITLHPTAIPDVLIVETRWFEDERGAFTEVYNHATFAAAGIVGRFDQENLAWSAAEAARSPPSRRCGARIIPCRRPGRRIPG